MSRNEEFIDKAETFIEQQETKLNNLRKPPTYQKKYDIKDNLDDYSKRIIAELEKKNDKLGTDLYNAENIVSDLQSQLAESEKKILELQEDSIRDNQIYNEHLAEKDLEIERLKQNYDEVWEDTYFSVKEDFELNNNCNECRRYYAEEFNKQLVEQLEKVKEIIANHTQELWTCENDDIDVVLYDEIDNQIKQLKEGK